MKHLDLPAHLAERTRPVADKDISAGEFVLYWMHHAVRADENPALDAASVAANALNLPLLVYQGLGGRHRYDSDRHHTFIIEGARDAAATLASRNVRHVFYLPLKGEPRSPLVNLAARAALVITEDFPAPPFPGWTRALAARIDAPVWRMDTACVYPMRFAERAFARAFEFRRAHGGEQLRRSAMPWPEVDVAASPFEGSLGFTPIDLDTADVASLCAACDIDHGIGPAPETRGGAKAALERWSAFLEHGLAGYHRLRNDAAVTPPRGVSRISPYLHHGHLSPFRVAREAAAERGDGAEKFLDELLIWRELAHNFCFHNEHLPGGLESIRRLPGWARETLEKHAGDERQANYEWERLARGETGDQIWDAAQRSLQIHGELHNNLRMTWGKALLGWTKTPERALEIMVDLNHRYALDGNDPNSYGGLLYCLGLFDRPFTPEQPVFGAVRSRSTRAHLKRLDLKAYRARMNTRSTERIRRVAVIGAGISGLAAARTLKDQGLAVTVVERAGRVGGRTAHRATGKHHFDHGAQYFTARDPRFRRHVASWLETGLVAPWTGRVVSLAKGGKTSEVTPLDRFVGVPGMDAMAKHLSEGLDLKLGHSVSGVVREGREWQIETSRGTLGVFDALVVAMPPEQLSSIAIPAGVRDAVQGIRMLPSWCAMAAFEAPLPLDFDAAFINEGVIDWIAHDSSKPERPAGERWVIHASAVWSAARLEDSPDTAAQSLLGEFFRAVGLAESEPVHLEGHRWSHAKPATEAQAGCVWLSDQAIALCGDWCLGGRVEGACLSGVAAAGRIVAAAVSPQSKITEDRQHRLFA